MSRMIPQRTVTILRSYVDISLDAYGIDCELFVPTNYDTVIEQDAYAKPEDFEYERYACKIFINWSPSVYRLKKLGLFVEGELPILMYLPRQAVLTRTGARVDVDVIRGSYVKVNLQYVPQNRQSGDEFELVDVRIRSMHDAEIVNIWKAVPRRIEIYKDRNETI